VSTAQRVPNLPQVPSLSDTFPGFEYAGWNGLFAPANTPKPIIDRLNAEVQRVYRLPDVQERMQKLGLEAVLSSPEELARYQQTEIVKWAKVVKESGAKAE
jgi:tripartite-type tricarboxylate transporter receptor subunit TctC